MEKLNVIIVDRVIEEPNNYHGFTVPALMVRAKEMSVWSVFWQTTTM